MKLDKTDKQIIKILQGFGRESASNIAEKLNVSVPTVTERIKKLQDSKIITGFQAILKPGSFRFRHFSNYNSYLWIFQKL